MDDKNIDDSMWTWDNMKKALSELSSFQNTLESLDKLVVI